VSDARDAAAFRRQVDRWIGEATAQGVHDFDELVRALPGVYPSLVEDGLNRLLGAGTLAPDAHRTALSRASHRRLPSKASGSVLPPPHPLDFDWRYAPEAIDDLLGRTLAATKPGDTVVLLGTPSLYLAAYQRRLDRRFVLIDYSSVILDRLASAGPPGTLHVRDLILDRIPDLSAAAVVADPPWYPEHIDAFLWAAASCARSGAPLFITLPAPGTRPGWTRDQAHFRERAAAYGLRAIRALPTAIRYVSPPFEINALVAAGWRDLPMDWRRGSLEILAASGTPPNALEGTGALPLWEERAIGWVRVRIRKDESSVIDPILHRVVDGDVLADVSRRHPIRDRVDVWTSGNRVFSCRSPGLLLVILDAMTLGVDPEQHVAARIERPLTRTEGARVAMSTTQLRRICRDESRELAKLGWKPPRRWDEQLAS
jgi:hypothetical protein